MIQSTVKLSIPFDSLVNSIKVLDLREKYRLFELLEEQVGQGEEDLLEKDSSVQMQIQEARLAYQSGDYETIDEYIARRKKHIS